MLCRRCLRSLGLYLYLCPAAVCFLFRFVLLWFVFVYLV